MNITLDLPLKIESEANLRQHWAKRAQRVKAQRKTVYEELWVQAGCRRPTVTEPLTVLVTRIAPRDIDDDNLAGGCKAVRDGIADWLGVDDGSKLVRYAYAQERGLPRQYRARIQIQAAGAPV